MVLIESAVENLIRVVFAFLSEEPIQHRISGPDLIPPRVQLIRKVKRSVVRNNSIYKLSRPALR